MSMMSRGTVTEPICVESLAWAKVKVRSDVATATTVRPQAARSEVETRDSFQVMRPLAGSSLVSRLTSCTKNPVGCKTGLPD